MLCIKFCRYINLYVQLHCKFCRAYFIDLKLILNIVALPVNDKRIFIVYRLIRVWNVASFMHKV